MAGVCDAVATSRCVVDSLIALEDATLHHSQTLLCQTQPDNLLWPATQVQISIGVDAGVAALAYFADYDMRKQEAQLTLQVLPSARPILSYKIYLHECRSLPLISMRLCNSFFTLVLFIISSRQASSVSLQKEQQQKEDHAAAEAKVGQPSNMTRDIDKSNHAEVCDDASKVHTCLNES